MTESWPDFDIFVITFQDDIGFVIYSQKSDLHASKQTNEHRSRTTTSNLLAPTTIQFHSSGGRVRRSAVSEDQLIIPAFARFLCTWDVERRAWDLDVFSFCIFPGWVVTPLDLWEKCGQNATVAIYFKVKSNFARARKSQENHPRSLKILGPCEIFLFWNHLLKPLRTAFAYYAAAGFFLVVTITTLLGRFSNL